MVSGLPAPVSHQHDVGPASAREPDGKQRAVKRQPSLFHLDGVVKGQHHFFQVPEVAVFPAVGNGRDKDVVRLVFVEYGRHLGDPREPVHGIRENVQRVRLASEVPVIRDLEEVADGETQLEEAVVEIDEDQQVPDARGVAEPVRGIDRHAAHGILAYENERPGSLVHGRLEDQRRVEEDLADRRDAAQPAIWLGGKRDPLRKGDRGHFDPRVKLAVDPGVHPLDVLLDIPVDAPDKVGKVLHRLVEGAVWPLVYTTGSVKENLMTGD